MTLALFLVPGFVQKIYSIFILLALTILTTLWALDFDLKFPEYLIFPIYPVIFTLGLFINVFLSETRLLISSSSGLSIFFPSRYLPAVVAAVFFAFSFYVLLLALNILNVATVRTVPLKKAALSTLYLVGIVIAFLSIRGVLTLELRLPILFLSIFLTGFFLAGAFFYLVQIETVQQGETPGANPPRTFWMKSVVLALITAEMGLVTSFIPLSDLVRTTFLTGMAFLLIGFWQHHIQRILTRKVIWEYVAVGLSLVGVVIGKGLMR